MTQAMIALTKEKREELIADCRKSIALTNAYISFHGETPELKSNLQRQEVALASLTAIKAPIKLKHSSTLPKFVDGTDKIDSYHCLIHADTMHHKTQEEAYAEAEVMCGVLYTAPPVPEINLPVMKGDTEPHTKYGEGVVDGYNRCLAEIKRLNGLGE